MRLNLSLIVPLILAVISITRTPTEVASTPQVAVTVVSPVEEVRDVESTELPDIPLDEFGHLTGLPVGEDLAQTDVLSLDGDVPDPPESTGDSDAALPAVPDETEPVESDAIRQRRQVILLSGPSCPLCVVAERAVAHLSSVDPTWTHGPQEGTHFRTLDSRQGPGREIYQSIGSPDGFPRWVIIDELGQQTSHVGWHGGNPTSQQAIDWLVSLYGFETADYAVSSGVGAAGPLRGKLSDALASHLRGKSVEGVYDTSFDMPKVIAKLMGGAQSVEVSPGLSLSLNGIPRLSMSSNAGATRVTITKNEPTISYRKGWFSTSAKIPYFDVNKDVSKLTVGLSGLPDFPIYLTW